MTHPAAALHDAVYGALKGAFVAGGKVFNRIPPKTALPYVRVGDNVVVSDFEGGGDFYDCDVLVEVFANSKPEAKAIAVQIATALTAPLTVVGFTSYPVEDVRITEFSDTGNDYVERADVNIGFKVQSA